MKLLLNSLFTLSCVMIFTQFSRADFGPRDCSKHNYDRKGFAWDERRGDPSEFDTGPTLEDGSSWLKLYGQVPNYRALGREILGGSDEKFRWTMGPMWYRGRLGKNQVKAFVVGQEGAQDENITNRAFTGSTGTRVQKFLNYLGIYENYLFMNTFIYTISGQRITEKEDPLYKNYVALEQGVSGPLVQYRHMLFDNVIKQNPKSIALFMAIGGGGKASLANWINTRSGNYNCREWDLEDCDTSGLVEYFAKEGILKGNEKILAIGVDHPGGAAFGDAGDRIKESFKRASLAVRDFIAKNKSWLPADSQEKKFASCYGGERIERLSKSFAYGHAPIPFKDFSFSTNWRMGDTGTTSNRNGADKIQVFSEQGRYAIVRDPSRPLGDMQLNSGRTVFNDEEPEYDRYSEAKESFSQLSSSKDGLLYGMKDFEVAYEHPRYSPYGLDDKYGDLNHVSKFDSGPKSKKIAQALMDWPNFQEINKKAYLNDESFGFGPSYRGNTKNPTLVILADQMGQTDFFSTRALTGEGGQRLQAFLKASGLEKDQSYLVLRSLPVDTIDIDLTDKIDLALSKDKSGNNAASTIANVLKSLPSNKILIAMGPIAQAITSSPSFNTLSSIGVDEVIEMDQPDSKYTHIKNWISVAKKINVPVPSEKELKSMMIIPRQDLPYSTRWWMGSTGERAQRAYGKSLYEKEINNRDFFYTGHYYLLIAPSWAKRLKSIPLNYVESEQIKTVLNEFGL